MWQLLAVGFTSLGAENLANSCRFKADSALNLRPAGCRRKDPRNVLLCQTITVATFTRQLQQVSKIGSSVFEPNADAIANYSILPYSSEGCRVARSVALTNSILLEFAVPRQGTCLGWLSGRSCVAERTINRFCAGFASEPKEGLHESAALEP